jgi:hypothetical protein
MRTFKVARSEHLEAPPSAGSLGGRARGFRAPGAIALVVREGTGWVMREDGSRETVEAGSVVVFEAGDWFEYGYDGNGGFKADSYWEADLSIKEWEVIFTQAFGADFWARAAGLSS